MLGKFITIYGINNIGKSTQAMRLVKKLESDGYTVHFVKYPIYDLAPTGPFLDKVLRSADGQIISEDELQLWFVLNRYQFEPQIKEWLSRGDIVIAEDYVGTGIAWGVAKGLDEKWMEEINGHLLKEDFAILFEGQRNMEAKEDIHVHEQNDELVEKCKEVHSHLADKHGWKKVLVSQNWDITTERLMEVVNDFLTT